MQIDFSSEKPIFMQIADGIQDAILAGVFPEESQIPSIAEIASTYKINPATAMKGINMLVDKQIIYKKRGLGMFVNKGALENLQHERKNNFYSTYIEKLVEEANRLKLSKDDLIKMINNAYE